MKSILQSKKIFFLYCYLNILSVLGAQIRQFNDLVLCTQDRLNAYAVFKVQSPQYTGRVVILVPYLYEWAEQKLKMSRDSFRIYLSAELYEHGCLRITDPTWMKAGFHSVSSHDSVSKYAALGKAAFLSHYFDKSNRLREPNLSEKEEYSVIAKLFEWNLACHHGHDTLQLYIVKDNLLWISGVNKYPTEVRSLFKTLDSVLQLYNFSD